MNLTYIQDVSINMSKISHQNNEALLGFIIPSATCSNTTKLLGGMSKE